MSEHRSVAIPGWHLVFVLVDDIPSVARVMRLTL